MRESLLLIAFIMSFVFPALADCAFTQIATGTWHTVAIASDSAVFAWGLNSNGQLGTGTTTNSNFPTTVLASGGVGVLEDIIAISGGGFHTVALRSDGTVWAWGSNAYGQLGDGSTMSSNVPVGVLDPDGLSYLSDVIAIAAGHNYTIALKNDGTVWSWGINDFGQLGNGTTANSLSPVQVLGPGGTGFLTDIIRIATGRNQTLAIKSDSTVWAWGDNDRGQLGDNTGVSKTTPVQVRGTGGVGYLTGIIAVSAGGGHSHALKSDGTVWSWGVNTGGLLGDGTTTQRNAPVQVLGTGGTGFLTDIMAIDAGFQHNSALRSDSTVWTWGGNGAGELGDGSTTGRSTPVQVHASYGDAGFLTGICAISAGDSHTVALKPDGTIWAWGLNSRGELGDSTNVNRNSPVQTVCPNSGIEEIPSLPAEMTLGVYPNPFNSSCAISAPEGAKIEIYDLRGKLVATPNADRSAFVPLNQGGQNSSATRVQGVIWTPDNEIGSGIYFVKAEIGDRMITKRVVLIR